MITVYVGPEFKSYAVHGPLLTQHKWFREEVQITNVLPRDIAEPNSITLMSEDPKVFELLISWLYRKKLNAISITDRVAKEQATLYVDLYLRACEWGIRELQNALMDRLRDRQTCVYGFFPRKMIKKVYEETEAQLPLRSFLVDSFIYKSIGWNKNARLRDQINGDLFLTRKRALGIQLSAGNRDFVLDCYEAMFQLCAKSRIRDPYKKTGCVYHSHNEGEKCWS